MLESAAWIDKPENRPVVAEIIAAEKYVGVSAEVIKMSMTGTFQYSPGSEPRTLPDFNVFHRYQSNFPWRSHAVWIISQMYRWGQLEQCINIKEVAETVYRPDIYRQAARELGLAFPAIDYKTEGEHGEAWTLVENGQRFAMGADRFLDGKVFNPGRLMDYMNGFSVDELKVSLSELAKMNS